MSDKIKHENSGGNELHYLINKLNPTSPKENDTNQFSFDKVNINTLSNE